MWLDLIGLLILGVFMLLGMLRGTLASFMRILSLLLAYGVALWVAPLLGPTVAARMALPDLLGVPIAGSLAFAAAYLVLGVVAKLLQVWERRQRRGEERGTADRVGGACLGAVQGAFIMLLIGWLGLWIDAGRATGALESLPDTSGSALGKISQVVMETGGKAMLDDGDPGARMALAMAARPRETVEGVQRILDNPRIRTLQSDRLFWSYVENGAIDAAMNQGSFLGIAYDATLREELANVGLIDQNAAADPRLFRNEARETFAEIGPRLSGLKNDPALKQLLQDPQVVAALESGDHLALLQNSAFRELVSRVMEGPPGQN